MLPLLALLLLSAPAQAIVNGNPPADSDTRFDAVGALSHGNWLGIDPDGNNAWENNWYCNATLIDPQTAVTAKHCVSTGNPDYYAIRFRRHLDGTIGTKDAGPASYHHVYVSEVVHDDLDFALLRLAEPVQHITPIEPLTYGVWGLNAGEAFWHAGWGREGPGYDEGPRNELLLCDNEISRTSEKSISFYSPSPQSGCTVNVYDSGSPILLEGADQSLRVTGVVSGLMWGSSGFAVNLAVYAEDTTYSIPHAPFDGPDLAVVDREEWEEKVHSTREGQVPVEPLLVNAGSELLPGARISGSLENSLTGEDFPFSPLDVTLSGARMEPLGMGIDYPADLPAGAYRVTLQLDPETSTTESYDSNNTWVSYDTLSLSPNPAEAGNYRLAVWLRGADLDGSVIMFEGDDGTLAVAAYSLGAGASIREPDLTLGTNGTVRLEDNGFGMTLTQEDDDWSLALDDASLVLSGFSVANGTRSMEFAAGVYVPEGHRAGSPGTMAIISPNGEIILSMDGSIPGDYSVPSFFTAPGHYELQANGGSADMAWDASRWTVSLDIDPGDGTTLDPIYLRAPDPPEIPDTGDTADTGDPADSGDTDPPGDTGDPAPEGQHDLEVSETESRCGCTSSPNPRRLLTMLVPLALLLSSRRRIQVNNPASSARKTPFPPSMNR